ncbi:MAG TPA: hypothetical protein VH477_05305 [Bryobacteraceae bacterium]|jgi:hypothetical protein
MKRIIGLVLLAWGAIGVCMAGSHDENWPVREQQTIEKTVPLTGEPMRLVVDNVSGYVHVKATNGPNVRITAHKTVRAETPSDLEASREVKLTIEGKPGSVDVYYDAPWRCNGDRRCTSDHRRFYEVRFDLDIEAPHTARTVVSTVNGGELTLDGTGDFDAGNVNGPIRMTNISGSGDAHTVNGPITIHFAKNPAGSCRFKTVNGSLDAYFPHDLSADLLFKTFNGEIFSDFDVDARVVPAAVTEHRGGKYIYRSNRASGGRAGKGGPELSFDTLNGSIRLHREQ